MRTDFKKWPYGAYLCDGSIVYFDRRYQPIVRLSQPDWSVTVCDPHDRIAKSGHEMLYDDNTSPTHDAKTRETLKDLLDAVPEMAAEVHRRSCGKRAGA